ncbi:MAG: hypothetical protein OJF49_001471 [Ktedonobacterales bacterium]|jgi:ABC-type transport system involved in multi-copper enzyme maturation permease subunit|nr:MAG: hypothetical protein OJF49_001471 [Ktedonobacterales bacterium]
MTQATASTATAPAIQGNAFTQTVRLTGWVLFSARRRIMSKVLGGVLLGLFVVIVALVVVAYAVTANSPVNEQNCTSAPVTATESSGGGTTVNGPPPEQCQPLTPAEQQQVRQQRLESVREPVTFPNSLALAGGYTTFIGLILLTILAGAVVGGEYGTGTIRLWFSRGVGRGQLVAAQVIALVLLALLISAVMLALGALVGVTIGPLLGGTLAALPAGSIGEILLYWLAIALTLFAYAVIAFFMATLGRSTAAGIAVPLGFFLFEVIVGPILVAIGMLFQGTTGEIVRHIPDWFLSPNTSYLVSRASESPIALNSVEGNTLGLPHALFVVALYCVALIVLGLVLTQRRDVTD